MNEDQEIQNNRPQNGAGRQVRDIRDSLSAEDLKVYNMFTHGREHNLASLRMARNKKLILEALHKHKGFVSKACEAAGISRRTYYGYVAEDPLFAEMVTEIREGIIDIAEDKLIKNIESGFEASIIFFLKTQGKRRGYGEVNQIGSFQGTQEEYYANKFNELDDTQLEEEIANLRKKLKLGNDAVIGGYGDDEQEDNSVEFEEEIPVKDIQLSIDSVSMPNPTKKMDSLIAPLTEDELLMEISKLPPEDRKMFDHTNKQINNDPKFDR